MNFPNSLDPDQARQKVGPDLDLSCLTLILFPEEVFEKITLKNDKKVMKNYQACKELIKVS